MRDESKTAIDAGLRTYEIYMTVFASTGITTKEVAEKFNRTPETVLIDLNYLADGNLIAKRGHRWYWAKSLDSDR